MPRPSRLVKESIRRVLRALGHRVSALDDMDNFEPLLYFVLEQRGRMAFVQLGANDGQYFDPLFRFVTANHDRVQGIVVEPLPDAFAQLQRAYARYPNIRPVNVAIHNSEAVKTLWRVDPRLRGRVPAWAHAIASFDPDHHKRANAPDEWIVAEQVPCVPLARLLADHGMTACDVLQIDTEGYDADILGALDFTRIKPALIHFEHGLSQGIMSCGTFAKILDRLRAEEYEFAISRDDATAYQRSLFLRAPAAAESGLGQ
jgi:FkbM family methyltransferase